MQAAPGFQVHFQQSSSAVAYVSLTIWRSSAILAPGRTWSGDPLSSGATRRTWAPHCPSVCSRI
ncbi:hypothetical protein Plhal304r1_c001g0004011 [Plasmopara halstedii]